MKVHVCGIVIGKTVFHLIGLSKEGHIVTKRRFSRKQLVTLLRIADLPCWHRGLSGCALPSSRVAEARPRCEAHAAQYVRPFVKSNKNDYVDAEAIAKAVQRPTVRFVPVKNEAQSDLQALHRVRDRWMGRKTAVINQLRGFLLEHGITEPAGPAHLKRQIPSILEDAENMLSPRIRMLLLELPDEWIKLEEQIDSSNQELAQFAKNEDSCRRFLTIPRVGPLTATALTAAIGNGIAFRKGRDLAAWLGLVPRQHSTAVPQATVACHRLRLSEHLLDAFDLGGAYQLATFAQVGDPPRLVVEGHQAHPGQRYATATRSRMSSGCSITDPTLYGLNHDTLAEPFRASAL